MLSAYRSTYRWIVALSILAITSAGVRAAEPIDEEGSARSPEQTMAMAEMQAVGSAYMDWLNDRNIRLSEMEFRDWADIFDFAGELNVAVTADEVAFFLVPNYIDEVPIHDPWGNAYGYGFAGTSRIWPSFGVRSGGRDRSFDSDEYVRMSYPSPEDLKDIVWVQDGFVSWPER